MNRFKCWISHSISTLEQYISRYSTMFIHTHWHTQYSFDIEISSDNCFTLLSYVFSDSGEFIALISLWKAIFYFFEWLTINLQINLVNFFVPNSMILKYCCNRLWITSAFDVKCEVFSSKIYPVRQLALWSKNSSMSLSLWPKQYALNSVLRSLFLLLVSCYICLYSRLHI